MENRKLKTLEDGKPKRTKEYFAKTKRILAALRSDPDAPSEVIRVDFVNKEVIYKVEEPSV